MKYTERKILSLIVPVGTEDAQFIKECLKDLDHQTIASGIEVILVGNLDIPEGQLESVADKISVEMVKTEAESIFEYWNAGIKSSNAPLVSVIHPADRYRRDAFEQFTAILGGEEDADLVYSDVLSTNQPNETFERHSARSTLRFPDYDRQTLLKRGLTEIRPVWRKDLHNKFGFLDEGLRFCADLEFWLRISDDSVFHRIPEFLTLRYEGGDVLSNRIGINNIDRQREFAVILTYYENNYSWKDGPVSEKITRLSEIEELFAQKQIETGFDELEKALSKDPQDQNLWVCKITHLMEASKIESAKSTLNEALKKFPHDVRLINYRGILLWRDGAKRQARTVLEEIIREKPMALEPRIALSEIYSKMGDVTRSVQQSLVMINQVGNNLSLYATLITNLLKLGDKIRARYYYHLAVLKYPDSKELQKISYLFSHPKMV